MVFLRLLGPLGLDFPQLWEAAYLWLHGGDPYQSLITSPGPFNYPPSSAWFLIWWGVLPLSTAYVVWNLVSLGLFLVSLWLILRLVSRKVTWPMLLVAIFLFTLPFFPEKFNLGNGQNNNFLLAFILFSFWLYQRKRRQLCALLLAFTIGIKLTPAIFLLYFLVKRDWRQLLLVGTWLGVLLILALVVLPGDPGKLYFGDIFWRGFAGEGKAVYYQQSLTGMLSRSFPGMDLTPWYAFLGGGLLLVSINALRRASLPPALAIIASLNLMLHPLTWQHHYVFAVIPLIVLWMVKPHWSLGAAYALLAFDLKAPNSLPAWASPVLSHQFWGILWLWFWSIKAVRDSKRLSATT